MSYTDEEVYSEVASLVAEGGWSSMAGIAETTEDAHRMAEGGWSSIYGYVSSLNTNDLRSRYDFLFEEEEEEDDDEEE